MYIGTSSRVSMCWIIELSLHAHFVTRSGRINLTFASWYAETYIWREFTSCSFLYSFAQLPPPLQSDIVTWAERGLSENTIAYKFLSHRFTVTLLSTGDSMSAKTWKKKQIFYELLKEWSQGKMSVNYSYKDRGKTLRLEIQQSNFSEFIIHRSSEIEML